MHPWLRRYTLVASSVRHFSANLLSSDHDDHPLKSQQQQLPHLLPLTFKMRRTSRLLASVKPARYLEANTPTGLTGLLTHPAPRSTLIYLYSSTLEKLKKLPEDSVYRQSTEALTKERLKIITSAVPAGYAEWAAKAKQTIAEHPEVFNTPEGGVDHDGGRHMKAVIDGKVFVTTKIDGERSDDSEEWNGEADMGPELEGTRSAAERKSQTTLGMKRPGEDEKTVAWDPEPPLNADQYVAELRDIS